MESEEEEGAGCILSARGAVSELLFIKGFLGLSGDLNITAAIKENKIMSL